MKEKDIKGGQRVKYPGTKYNITGTGSIDLKNPTGVTGKVLVAIGVGSRFFPVEDLELA